MNSNNDFINSLNEKKSIKFKKSSGIGEFIMICIFFILSVILGFWIGDVYAFTGFMLVICPILLIAYFLIKKLPFDKLKIVIFTFCIIIGLPIFIINWGSRVDIINQQTVKLIGDGQFYSANINIPSDLVELNKSYRLDLIIKDISGLACKNTLYYGNNPWILEIDHNNITKNINIDLDRNFSFRILDFVANTYTTNDCSSGTFPIRIVNYIFKPEDSGTYKFTITSPLKLEKFDQLELTFSKYLYK